VPLADPAKLKIVERRLLDKLVCRRCGALNPIGATKCRRCKSRNLRPKRKKLGTKKG